MIFGLSRAIVFSSPAPFLGDTQDEPMPFSDPEELLEKFTTLEEDNLKLIHRIQALDETLDNYRQTLEHIEHEKCVGRLFSCLLVHASKCFV